jgi:hypothetical protein
MQFGEIDDRRKLMAITYNNMSCLFKRKGLLKTALGYAEKVPLHPCRILCSGILAASSPTIVPSISFLVLPPPMQPRQRPARTRGLKLRALAESPCLRSGHAPVVSPLPRSPPTSNPPDLNMVASQATPQPGAGGRRSSWRRRAARRTTGRG